MGTTASKCFLALQQIYLTNFYLLHLRLMYPQNGISKGTNQKILLASPAALFCIFVFVSPFSNWWRCAWLQWLVWVRLYYPLNFICPNRRRLGCYVPDFNTTQKKAPACIIKYSRTSKRLRKDICSWQTPITPTTTKTRRMKRDAKIQYSQQ